MRPGLIVCDDLEDDEQVENKERRDKFRRWFNRAVLPALRRGGKARVHGTILHEDSLLARFHKEFQKHGEKSAWVVQFHRAHKSFDDFSDPLWPEQWPIEELKRERQKYINDYDAAGYSQEYLNDPYDNNDTYLKKEWFKEMEDDHFDQDMRVSVGVDFAISKSDKANRTSFTTAGQDAQNFLNFFHQWVGRWGTDEIIENMIALQERFDPIAFFVEDGVIWKAIEPILNIAMREKNVFLNCIPLPSIKDKATRGRSFQRRMKAGTCRFDKQAEWYAPYEHELLRFTGYSEAVLDDQFDSSAILSRGFDSLPLLTEEDFMTDDELYFREVEDRSTMQGRSPITGY
jgi:phage terminase large subunit-like protein